MISTSLIAIFKRGINLGVRRCCSLSVSFAFRISAVGIAPTVAAKNNIIWPVDV